jgi:hypothetical protein
LKKRSAPVWFAEVQKLWRVERGSLTGITRSVAALDEPKAYSGYVNFGPVFIDHDYTTRLLVPIQSDEVERCRRWRLKIPLSRRIGNQNSVEAGYARCAYLEITLMNFDYRGAVNFLAIIIGH